MRKINVMTLFSIFFLIIFSMSVSAIIGEAESYERGWGVTYSTDEDYFVHFDSIGRKNTLICLLHKTASNMGELANSKQLFTKNEELLTILHPQMRRIDSENYFGYCHLNVGEKYLKFGEHSTVVEYQEDNLIIYDCGSGKTLNVTLYKNTSEGYVIDGDIFVFNYPNRCKFGANDTSNTGREVYKYVLDFTLPYVVESEDNLIHVYDWEERLIHEIDLTDICSVSNMGCNYNEVDSDTLEVTFDSEMFIDPEIIVTPIPSSSIVMTALGENRVALARTILGNLSLYLYYTNGTLISSQQTNTGLGDNARAEIKARTSNEFVLYWFNDFNNTAYFQFYNDIGENTSSVIRHEDLGSEAVDFNILFRDSGLEDLIYIAYQDDLENEFDLDIFNLTDLTELHYTLDDNSKPEHTFYNLQGCDFANSTLIVCSYYDDDQDDTTFVSFDVINRSVVNITDIDIDVGGDGQIDAVVYGNAISSVYFDSSEDEVKFEIRNISGQEIISPFVLNDTMGTSTRVSISAVYSDIYSQMAYLVTYADTVLNDIKAEVYLGNGTRIYQYTLTSELSTTNLLYDTLGVNDYLGLSLNNGTYALSYVNTTGNTLLNFYYLNGTESRLITLDTEIPTYDTLSPPNNTHSNQSQQNFSVNASDDVDLANATLFIYNETGSLINQTTGELLGTQQIFSVIYNFLTEGIYTWFIQIFDTAGNFVQTVTRTIFIDSSAPIIGYIPDTPPNGTQSVEEHIHINVSVSDLDLDFISIDVHFENGTLVESLNSTDPSIENLFFDFHDTIDGFKYRFNVTACDVLNQCSYLEEREVTYNLSILETLELVLEIEQFPYLDLNVTYLFNAVLTLAGTNLSGTNTTLFIVDGTNTTVNMPYNSTSATYQSYLTFTEEDDYTYVILSQHIPHLGDELEFEISITDEFFVRSPYFVTFNLFELKDQSVGSYKNDFAYIFVEPMTSRFYDANLENFITPVLFKETYNQEVFHEEYTSGSATIKLWEDNTPYVVRLVDGFMTFENDFSVPQIQKTHGTNIYLGNFTFSGNESYNLYLEPREIKPYYWLFNIGLIILIILCLVGAVFLFFIVPQFPMLSIGMGLVFPIILIILRAVVYLWLGT